MIIPIQELETIINAARVDAAPNDSKALNEDLVDLANVYGTMIFQRRLEIDTDSLTEHYRAFILKLKKKYIAEIEKAAVQSGANPAP